MATSAEVLRQLDSLQAGLDQHKNNPEIVARVSKLAGLLGAGGLAAGNFNCVCSAAKRPDLVSQPEAGGGQ